MTRAVIRAHLAALALRVDDSGALSPRTIAMLLALHLFGLAAFWQLLHQPIWLAAATLALLLLAPLLTWRSRGGLAIETLAPLFFFSTRCWRCGTSRFVFSMRLYLTRMNLR